MDLEEYLYDIIVPLIQSWNEKDIYAISFFVYTNEYFIYEGNCNFPQVSVGYNTEEDCSGAPLFDEERWNFAFWRQNNVYIIDSTEATDGAEFLLNWYRSKGITNIGFEDSDLQYDDNMNYIGKGPVGYYEVLCAVSNVAKRIQSEGILARKFGRIPVIVHDLEYTWYVEEATRNANPGGEADVFLAYLHKPYDDFPGKDEACRELADFENKNDGINTNEKIGTHFTSVRNAIINSPDDAIKLTDKFLSLMAPDDARNIIDRILPLIADETSNLNEISGNFFTHLQELRKEICDDADTE